jgi:hypothetical protein
MKSGNGLGDGRQNSLSRCLFMPSLWIAVIIVVFNSSANSLNSV